ncbi:MAG: acetylesterase, partial [Clostridiales bacterium]|nr:acetylesterase [Clostridiales bacterium]
MAVLDITLLSNTLRRSVPLTAILPIEDMMIPGAPPVDRTGPFRSIYLLHGFIGDHKDWL